MADEIKFKFTSWNGPGQKLAGPNLPSSFDAKSIAKIEDGREEKELEVNLQKIAKDLNEHVDRIGNGIQKNELFKLLEIGEKNRDIAQNQFSFIYSVWENLNQRYVNGEKNKEILNEYEKCKKDLEELEQSAETWKKEKVENDKFLEDNKGWNDQFRQASAQIVEFQGTADEFAATYAKRRKESNFPFNLKEKLLSYAEKTDDDVKSFGSAQLKIWKKMLGAAKMINNPDKPKTVVIFEEEAYGVNEIKHRKLETRKDAVEFLNKLVIKKLKDAFVGSEVKNVFAQPLKYADLRYMAFIVGKEMMEDENILKGLMAGKVGDLLFKKEEEKVNVAIENILKDDRQGLNELIIRTYVYNEIGKAIAEEKKLSAEESYSKQLELVDPVLSSFNDKLKSKIAANFIEKRKDLDNSGTELNQSQRDEIKKIVNGYIKKSLVDVSKKAEPEKTKPDPNIATKNKTEKSDKTKKELSSEVEKSNALDELVALVHQLFDELHKKDGIVTADQHEKIDKFFEEVNISFHELHDAKFDDDFKKKKEEVRKAIENKLLEVSKIVKLESEAEINFEQQLKAGNDVSGKLFKAWEKLSDFERESPEFEGIYHLIDVLKGNFFKEDLERINLTKGLSEEEKKDRIARKITYLQSILNMVEEKLKKESKEKKENKDNIVSVVEKKEISENKTENKVEKNSEAEEKRIAERSGIFERKKRAQFDVKMTPEELKKELDIVRQKYKNACAEKEEKYKILCVGLGGKLRYDVLMAEDKDIIFYRKDYQQVLEQYLVSSFDNINERTNAIVAKNGKIGWFDQQWQKVKDKLFHGNAKSLNKSDEAFLKSSSVSDQIETVKTGGDTNVKAEGLEKVSDNKFEYEGGINRMKNDLLLLMNAVVNADKKNIAAGGSGQSLRNVKISELISGKNKKDFASLPERGQVLIKNMTQFSEIGLDNKELTLRNFVQKILEFTKSLKG
ncbi:MAG: hypothetical protein ACD_9C00116G0004 [uncultured bacterium]|nr:MAG: hypothetical protein ACD_9C00116G0004 [uncultured bacterium]